MACENGDASAGWLWLHDHLACVYVVFEPYALCLRGRPVQLGCGRLTLTFLHQSKWLFPHLCVMITT